MSQAPTTETKLDNLYLKFFKYAVVGLMTLALLAIVVLIPMAVFQYFQSPAPPTPAKAPPDRAVNFEDFKKFLIDEEKRRLEQEKSGNTSANKQPVNVPGASQLYAEQALALNRCSDEFQVLAKLETENPTAAQIALDREKLRAKLEEFADHQFRGQNWINAMVVFTCSVLKNPEIVKLRIEKTIGAVMIPSIFFHSRVWATIEQEKFEFRQAEERRVSGEVLAENVRVAASKIRAVFMLTSAGGALLFFMAMALYLIFAKIEDNLALIHRAIVQRTLPTVTTA